MNRKPTLKRTLFAVIFVLSSAAGAYAGSLRSDLRACHETCNTIADECQFLNDLDTCEASRRACRSGCDERYPTLALCVDQCDGLLLFCRNDGVSSRGACREENQMCVSRCESAVVSRLD